MPQIRPQSYAQRQAPQNHGKKRKAGKRGPSAAWQTKMGAWFYARLREAQYDTPARRVFQILVIGILISIFVVTAWATGLIAKGREFVSQTSITAVRLAGFTVKKVEFKAIAGTNITQAEIAQAKAISGIIQGEILFEIHPEQIKSKIKSLFWVEDVFVRRLLPDSVEIIIVPRTPRAVWRNNNSMEIIDAEGKSLGKANQTNSQGLPLVEGQNANIFASEIFKALETRKSLAGYIFAMRYIDNRRWDLQTFSGAIISLPSEDIETAFEELFELQNKTRILNREFARLDLRFENTLILRPKAQENQVLTTQPPQPSEEKKI